MDNAMHISRIIGPVFFILSLIIMFDKKRVDEAIKSLQEITGLQLIVGMVNLLLGLIIISFYNVWAWNWGLLVTVFAWFAVLRGVLILLFPKVVRGFKVKTEGRMFFGFIFMAWSILLCWFGFFPM
ncbi:MAG: hypothetical protein A3F16_03125 [Deltaproteobacteria bacterium RIFCSPHIGHO2_12_FULL_43_9]|nr:MAG: hypothetical protein A3F16_03125 [Deltaproteobacteria bacterium RIFCSPHIGHO2_12_FULL_43_9]